MEGLDEDWKGLWTASCRTPCGGMVSMGLDGNGVGICRRLWCKENYLLVSLSVSLPFFFLLACQSQYFRFALHFHLFFLHMGFSERDCMGLFFCLFPSSFVLVCCIAGDWIYEEPLYRCVRFEMDIFLGRVLEIYDGFLRGSVRWWIFFLFFG
ncbi:uncharacterized protein EI97DRAFT_106143 [Westerdykella ornata]|uniref:Transmembrane protein n=1 Tax=Westerdykella ornata TaxID=318751 RepID=A0A6A6JW45_WESOR|nr:uncharacterized protein EI97DRAFT_106143 [Westerdykella ornata]KAF2279956.1 hypothetical protein EI97DRAFT_106143 [Westerdykella ornata]